MSCKSKKCGVVLFSGALGVYRDNRFEEMREAGGEGGQVGAAELSAVWLYLTRQTFPIMKRYRINPARSCTVSDGSTPKQLSSLSLARCAESSVGLMLDRCRASETAAVDFRQIRSLLQARKRRPPRCKDTHRHRSTFARTRPSAKFKRVGKSHIATTIRLAKLGPGSVHSASPSYHLTTSLNAVPMLPSASLSATALLLFAIGLHNATPVQAVPAAVNPRSALASPAQAAPVTLPIHRRAGHQKRSKESFLRAVQHMRAKYGAPTASQEKEKRSSTGTLSMTNYQDR
jgi:hypothetical protein